MTRAFILSLCLALSFLSAIDSPVHAANLFVAPNGNDKNAGTKSNPWRTVQKACDAAVPGTVITVASGVYYEKITFNVSGSASGGFITLQGEPGAVISGSKSSGDNIITIRDKSYISITGFELKDNLKVTDGSGIRVEGMGNKLEFRNNKICRILGKNAMGITVYGTNSSKSVSNLVISGNEIFDCQPAPSEALTLNGNVQNFEISNNYVHNVNNIGIDMIGGEKMCPVPANDAARQGVCRDNRVSQVHSLDEGGYAGAIYVDGARDIIIERNSVSQSDVGLSVGAENKGVVANNIIVRDNLIYKNEKRGLSFGGYDATRGRVKSCQFLNNTCWQNDTLATGDGELHIEFSSGNTIKNNIFVAGNQNLLLTIVKDGINNTLNNNLWYSTVGPQKALFLWKDNAYTGFDVYRSASGQDGASNFADPRFQKPGSSNFRPVASSPAVNAGDPAFKSANRETDLDGQPRLQDGRVDTGAYECQNFVPANQSVSPTSSKSNAGTVQTFTTLWTDKDGASDIKEVRFLINGLLDEKASLYAVYNLQTNKIYLRNNAGTGWINGSGVAPGSSVAPLQNSQGALDVANTVVTQDGNSLSIRWVFTPKSEFLGKKNLYLWVTDSLGATRDWTDKGDWTILPSATQPSSQAS